MFTGIDTVKIAARQEKFQFVTMPLYYVAYF